MEPGEGDAPQHQATTAASAEASPAKAQRTPEKQRPQEAAAASYNIFASPAKVRLPRRPRPHDLWLAHRHSSRLGHPHADSASLRASGTPKPLCKRAARRIGLLHGPC